MIGLIKNTFYNEAKTKEIISREILDEPFLSMGRHVAEFESAFSSVISVENSVMMSSGSCANLALLQALKNLGRLSDGDRVGVSAITWATNVMPVIQLGMVPVPIDVELDSLNVSHRLIPDGIKAFFATHVLGLTDNLTRIKERCDSDGVIFLEDACEALGTRVGTFKRPAGSFGLASTFSFFVAHQISSIEGGAACTSDPELADMLRMVRSNGWGRNVSPQKQDELYNGVDPWESKYTFFCLGYNFRPTEISAICAKTQLESISDIVSKREDIFNKLNSVYRDNEDFYHITNRFNFPLSAFAFPVICKTKGLRDLYFSKFTKNQIETRPIISGNITRQPFWRKHVSSVYQLKNADTISDNGFYCGIYPEMTYDDIDLIASCLENKK